MTVTTPTQLYILIYTSTTTHAFVQPFYLHQRISKKLQYIGATLFMAVSLGVLSLSYWAQVHIQDLVLAIASLDFNYNFSELWVWTDCSSTSWFGCWQFGTHPWIRHGLVDFIAHCSMNNGHGHANAILVHCCSIFLWDLDWKYRWSIKKPKYKWKII